MKSSTWCMICAFLSGAGGVFTDADRFVITFAVFGSAYFICLAIEEK